MTAGMLMSASGAKPVPARHAVRATRVEGRRTRSLLLDAAARLFRAGGLAAVSIADIAAGANAFPSQVTYYFCTKEALFVEAACREVLYAAKAAEDGAAHQTSPQAYSQALAEHVIATDALSLFAEAMVLARHRADLAPLIERTLARLHDEGERAYMQTMHARRWRSQAEPAITARRFWALAISVTLQGVAAGLSRDDMVAQMMRLAGPQAEDARVSAAGRANKQGTQR